MAKKTVTKKPKRRLKRTVRRSLAAVLMITAIVVAAIPVPENRAEDGVPGQSSDVQAALTYVPASKENGYVENAGGEHHISSTSGKDCWEIDVDRKNNPGGGLPTELSTALQGGDLRATVRSTYRDGNVLYLEWEFLYHPGKKGSKKATLCKYNNEKDREKVRVGELLRTDYQTVTRDQFNAYYSEDPKGNYTDTVSNPMDNLKETNALYPNTQITYGIYHQTLKAEHKKFLEKYFPEKYAQAKADIDAWNNNVSGEPMEEPAELVITPRLDLNDKQKIEFYCEHNEVLTYFDTATFTLALATDLRLQDNGQEASGEAVYVAQSETKSADLGVCEIVFDHDGRAVPYVIDENGCLAKKDPLNMLDTIGERAFAGVTNVGEIEIPNDIAVIGDRAFEGAGMRSVQLNNDAVIGNRTFAQCTQLTTVKFGENSGTYKIGAEAFYGCSKLADVKFPWSMQEIGYGAFANCESLSGVDFSVVNSGDVC